MPHRRYRLVPWLVLVGLLGSFLTLSSTSAAPGDNPSPTPSSTTRLPGHVLPRLDRATRIAPRSTAPEEQILLTVVLNWSDSNGFDAFLRAAEDRNARGRRPFASQADLTRRFGPSQQTYQRVEAYLARYGFQVVGRSDNRLTLTVRGTRAQAEQAFGVQLNDYELNGRVFRANDANPAVPSQLAPAIKAVLGLDNLATPRPRHQVRATTAPRAVGAPNGTPQEMAQAYNFPGVLTSGGAPADGSGQTIGLLEFDTFSALDVRTWLERVGLPASLLNNVYQQNVAGGVTSSSQDGVFEVLLDIDTALGMAPGTRIGVYSAPPAAGFVPLLNAMLGDGVNVISVSWGACEYQATLAEMQSIEAIMQSAAASGVPTFVAAGDHGPDCNSTGSIDPGIPEDAPHAIAVGGTTLLVNSDGSYASEKWWDSGNSAGGQGAYGVSCCFGGGGYFARPSYQDGFTSSAGRSVPDVVADADPDTGMLVYDAAMGGYFYGGGTSMAAPEWAAGMALLNQVLGPQGNFAYTLYGNAGTTAFHSPSQMTASLSGATNNFAHLGLGSFNLGQMRFVLAGGTTATPTATASATATPVAAGTTTPTATATLITTGTATPTVTVAVTATPTATATRVPTATPTPVGVACSPRPAVSVQTSVSGPGVLAVSIGVGSNGGGVANTLQRVVVQSQTNATTVLPNGQRLTGAGSLSLPAGTTSTRLLVSRVTAGAATTVQLGVVDGCGNWPTFVGGGPTAF